jgi:glutathione synthase/RimK-type ligase-like ATP-grasp enzyme
LLTTDPDAVEAFWEHHGHIIYKSISGVRSIVSRLTPKHRERFANLSNCPTQFQEWIEGVDIRVHVVGDDVFASRVESIATDYRYPQTEAEQPKIEAFDLPSDLVERCWRLMTSLSLELAGIDLRLTDDGRWFCFEVNPSPGFTYYEQATGQPIARSIARLLACTADSSK